MDNDKIKSRIFNILESSPESGFWGKCFGIFIVVLISLNVATAILETVQSIYSKMPQVFDRFEFFFRDCFYN